MVNKLLDVCTVIINVLVIEMLRDTAETWLDALCLLLVRELKGYR